MTSAPEIITIFGGTGFLGRAIVSLLAAEGYRIRIPTRNPVRVNPLRVMGDVGQIVPVTANWRDPDAMVAGSSIVINLLGILFQNNRQRFDTIHHLIPAQLAGAATRHKVKRFLHVSAIGAGPHARAAYAKSKTDGEQAVMAAFGDATIFRPSVVFGPDDDFFNRFGNMMLTAPALPLIGGGQTLFQPVYVGDVALAFQAALHDPQTKGQLYYLGGPAQWSFEQILRYLLTITGQKRFLAPLPWKLANILARMMEFLPNPPLTRDQIIMLRDDNIVPQGVKVLADLGIQATAIEAIVPRYLKRFQAAF